MPDNLEDAIILAFLWAEYFVKTVLWGIYLTLLRLDWYLYNRNIRILDRQHKERLKAENESNQKV